MSELEEVAAVGPEALADTAIAQSLKIGVIVEGRYEVVSKLAVGGMGEVYKARHLELGKPVVLKVMLSSMSRDEALVARFKREAIAASRIGQQNIVDVSDFGRTPDGRFFFVMEYLDGVTLKTMLADGAGLPLARVTRLSLQIANALAAAHAQGVVHRDLKPDNLMVLQRPGQIDFVKVLDFGVAKVTPAPGEAGHTSFGMIMGTPQYMSPEQARAVTLDARSDVYSLGLVIYEMLVGRPTFEAETPSLLMVKHLTEPPPHFEPRLAAKLPAEVERLVHRMLAKDPADRPQSMTEVIAQLEAIDDLARGRFVAAGATLVGAKSVVVAAPAPAPARPAPAGDTLVLARPPAVEEDEPLALPPRSSTPLIIGAAVALALGAVTTLLLWPRESSPAPVATRPDVPPLPTSNDVVVPPAPSVAAPVVAPVAPPTQLETPTAATITLAVTGAPSAEVFEGDVRLGVTPLPLSRPANASVELTFQAAGFKPLVRRVGFLRSQTLTFALEKVPAPVPVPAARPAGAPATKPYPFND